MRLELYDGVDEEGLTNQDIPVYGFSNDSEQTLNMGSQSTGPGAGKIAFDPVSVLIPADGTMPLLFAHEASGTPFSRAVLTVYQPGTTTTAYVEIFGLAAVKTQSVNNRYAGSFQDVTFEYGYQGLIARGRRSGWNRVRNVSCAPADPGVADSCIPQ